MTIAGEQGGVSQASGTAASVRSPRPAAASQVALTIDGQQATCEPGATILEVAQRLGIHIPTLCHEPRLRPSAVCRICLVEVEGAEKPVPSCSTTATNGMVVHTQSEALRRMRHLYLELLLSDHNSFCTPPCRDSCPTHIKIPQFLDAIAHGDYTAGVRQLRQDLPFPAILGRVCPHPCETPCRRHLVDRSIDICLLHRFVADQCIDAEQTGELLLPVEGRSDTGKTVAIVGAGPAGLTCAFYARLEGHSVKVFEAQPKPGGMLRYAIPRDRLPSDVLDKELNVLWRMGVEIECGKRFGDDFDLDGLTAEFDAVFLGLGAFDVLDVDIDSEDASLEFCINDDCTGCGLCARRCPAQCISGERKQQHVIDTPACVRCATCYRVCKFGAIDFRSGVDQAIAVGRRSPNPPVKKRLWSPKAPPGLSRSMSSPSRPTIRRCSPAAM